jgi:FeS assembly SUF system protein
MPDTDHPLEPDPIRPEAPAGPPDATLESRVIDVLRTIYDPEIPVDVYELGLVYGVEVRPDRQVRIRMTLTSPACPVAGSLPGEVEEKVKGVEGVADAVVELVWDPPWDMSKLSEAARMQLGLP